MDNKEIIKKQIKKNLEKKNIILFGAGKDAEEFYIQHKAQLNISHCISNLKKQWGDRCFLDVLDVRPYNRDEITEADYIVVCGVAAYRILELQLMGDGLSVNSNFVDYRIANAVLEEKDIILFRGSCVLRDAYVCLKKVKEFSDRYATIYVQDKTSSSKYSNGLLMQAAQICDIYIYSHRVTGQDISSKMQQSDLAIGCKTLSVCNQSFSGYWPQADPDISHKNPYWIHPYVIERDQLFYHNLYMYTDRNINKLIEEGKSTSEIKKILSDCEFYSQKDIDKNLKRAYKAMQIADQFADVKMADFIIDNCRERMVFQNFMHMEKCVVWEYVRRILQALQLDMSECDVLERKSPKYIHHGSDIPVYPSVIEKMGLSWVNENTEYEIVTYDGVVKMNFMQYIEVLADYTKISRKIMMGW